MFTRLVEFENFIFKWGLAVILLAIPLYPKFPLFNIPGTYVAVRMEDILLAALGIFLLLKLVQNHRPFFQSSITRAFLLFLAAGLVSIASGILLTHTVVPHIGLLHWVRRIEYVVPFFLAYSFARSEKHAYFFIEVLLVAAFLVFLYGLGQIHFGFPVISTQNAEFSKGLALRWLPGARLHSTFGGHYDLAAFLVLALPIGIAYLFALRNIVGRALIFGVTLCLLWLLVTAASRISVAAYFVGLVVTLWFLKKRAFLVFMMAISIAFVISSDLAGKYKFTLQQLFGRVEVTKIAWAQEEGLSPPPAPRPPAFEDRSTAIRLNVEWPRALRAFSKNPLLGTGFSSITLATDNDYLRMLGEVGVVGTLAFFLVLMRIGQKMWGFLQEFRPNGGTLASSDVLVVGTVGAAVGLLANAAFIDVFEASKVALIFWTLLGISVGIINTRMKRESREENY